MTDCFQFTFFFPTIAISLGYGPIITLLLTAPPWAFATIVGLILAWYADRAAMRSYLFIGVVGVATVGAIIAMTTRTVGPRYFAFFLMCSKSDLASLSQAPFAFPRADLAVFSGLFWNVLDRELGPNDHCSASGQTCGRHRHCQCRGQHGGDSGGVSVAVAVGSLLCPVVRSHHRFHGRCGHSGACSALLSRTPQQEAGPRRCFGL